LLLTTFPLMSFFLFFTGSAFFIPDTDGKSTSRVCGIGNLSLYGRLLSRRRSCTVHIFCGMFPSVHPRCRHVFRDR
jgi:hypothetical protein